MLKSRMITAVFGCVTTLVLSGCIDQAAYETTPVEVKTSKGIVMCQLYRPKQVIWDEAISVPKGMTIKQGDQVCINEGKRRLKNS